MEMEMEGETMKRIFIGGLGESVTADDIRKTFSSLGTVEGVDIIRNNGRSFAYIDFVPSSDKSLPKLFSTYNRCIWKGGKLRLEKAKEHYLVRLKREWAEDAELASQASNNNLDACKIQESSRRPQKVPTLEKMQLRVFFPRLQKVKSLPYSGTGKHKYSFQRIEVPSLPIHFCDCEEHCDPCDTVRREHVSAPETNCGGMYKEELNLMNSVMNKLFERDFSKAADSEKGSFMEGDYSNQVIEDVLPRDENEADMETDEDNLIINMVSGASSGLGSSQGMETILAEQKSRLSKLLASDDIKTQKELKNQKRKNIVPFDGSSTLSNKKTCLLPADESNTDKNVSIKPEKIGNSATHPEELEGLAKSRPTKSKAGGHQSNRSLSWEQKSSWRVLIGEIGNSSFSISHILPDTAAKKHERPNSKGLDAANINESEHKDEVKHGNVETPSKEIEGLTEETQPTRAAVGSCDSTKGLSWLQKSSWRELVGDVGNTSFSISHILPGIVTKQEPAPKINDVEDAVNSIDNKNQNLVKQARSESTGDSCKSLGAGEEELSKDEEEQKFAGEEGEKISHGKKLQIVKDNNTCAELPEKKSDWALKKTSMVESGIGEFCSFMRSSVSEREWMKTKTALSGSLKKKSIDK